MDCYSCEDHVAGSATPTIVLRFQHFYFTSWEYSLDGITEVTTPGRDKISGITTHYPPVTAFATVVIPVVLSGLDLVAAY